MNTLRAIWHSPHLFVYVIMLLYAGSVIRYAFAKNLFGVCYWLSALGITLTVTFIKKA
jgi:hypothetical protein